jgi:hypothetical protein
MTMSNGSDPQPVLDALDHASDAFREVGRRIPTSEAGFAERRAVAITAASDQYTDIDTYLYLSQIQSVEI